MLYKGFLREHSSISAALYAIADMAMISFGGILAYALRFGSFSIDVQYRGPLFLCILIALLIFPFLGLYDSWRGRSPLDQVRNMSFGWMCAVLGMILVGFLLKDTQEYSRIWIGSWFLISWILLCLGRVFVTLSLRWLRVRGWNHRRILIIGTDELAPSVARRIYDSPWSGWELIGAVDLNGNRQNLPVGVRIFRNHKDLESLIRRAQVDEAWLCVSLEKSEHIDNILWQLRHCTITLRLLPNIHGLRLIQHPVTDVLGMPMLNLSMSPVQGINRLVKAAEDRVLSAIILLFISPLMLLIAIGVKLSSPGPVFFRQHRVSWNGKAFAILKFRSMPVNAESRTGPQWAREGEERATRFGRFIRKTSLDELPQFFNVLIGNMSIVGPRPERPVFVEQFKEEIPDYMRKHLVKAGMTGWAQINGWRGNTDLKKRIEYDLYYIENWSLWFDLKIILLTVFKGFIHKNAY